MTHIALAAGFALFLWWLTTGVVLYLNHLPPRTYRWSLAGATVLFAASLYGLVASRAELSFPGALHAFACALLLWAWLEMSYLMGIVTGPNKAPCPPGARGWRRFVLALRTSLYHELAVVAVGLAVLALLWDAPNRLGAWTFLALWLLRWSAKLNLFLGVPNLNEDWLPPHLRYLGSYIPRRPMNLLFPVSVTAATAVTGALVLGAAEAATPFARTGLTLLATLLALGLLEHWFLVLPLRDSALWAWALRLAGREPAPDGANRRPAG